MQRHGPATARNVLFLWTDQQRPDTIGAYGNPAIATPHLDRLAAGGVLFEQAYCATPICTPSRATVLTGLCPHTHGALRNNVPLPANVPTIAELLQPYGFTCGYAGKWHLGNELGHVPPGRHGFEWWASMEDEYTADHAQDGFSDYHHWLLAKGFAPQDRAHDGALIFSRETAARLPEHAGKPAFLAEQAIRFLDAAREPFALYVNFLEPHFPYWGPWNGRYAPEDVALPASWYGAPDPGMPLRYRVRREGFARPNPHLDADDEAGWRAMMARYWGLASLVDKYCGVILDHLATRGLADDTIVVFSSDHGDMMGEHRLIAKAMPYEGAARVPLILRLPGVAPRRVQTPVSQIDLVPTLLDALGCAIPDHLPGRSLLSRLDSQEPPPCAGGEDDAIVIEWAGVPPGGSVSGYRPPAADTPGAAEVIQAMACEQRTIRQGDWKLTVDEGGEHELYHLADDPGEQRNLLFAPRRSSLSPEARAAIRTLWAALRAWQRRTADALHLPDPAWP